MISSITQRLSLWTAPQQNGKPPDQPVDAYLATQREEDRAYAELEGLALQQKLHGPERGVAAEMGRLSLAILDTGSFEPNYNDQQRQAISEALAKIETPDPTLLRKTVHLGQVLQARLQDPETSDEVYQAAPDLKFVQDLKAQLKTWGHELPKPCSLAHLPLKLARVSPEGQVHAQPTHRRSPELRALLKSQKPEEATAATVREIVSHGATMSEGESDVLYQLLCSQDPKVRALVIPLLPAVKQIATDVVEAGLDRPPSKSDWPGALLSAIKLGHPEAVDADWVQQAALFCGSPNSNANHRAFSDLAEACEQKPELWDFAAHVVLTRARQDEPFEGTFEFLDKASQAGWKPSPAQLSQITGQTLAAAYGQNNERPENFVRYRIMNEGLNVLRQHPNPHPWKSQMATLVFDPASPIEVGPWPDNLAALAAERGHERILTDLENGAMGRKAVDELPKALRNVIRALPDDPRVHKAIEPLLGAPCQDRSIEDIVQKRAKSYLQSGPPLAYGLQVEQAWDRRCTWEPRDGGWEKLISRWTASEVPATGLAEPPEGFFQAASNEDKVFQKTLDLVRLKAPDNLAAGMLLMGDVLRSEKTPFGAWRAFIREVDSGTSVVGSVRARVLDVPAPSAGVSLGQDNVMVGGVALRTRRRS